MEKDIQIPKFASFRPKLKPTTSDHIERRDKHDVHGSTSNNKGQDRNLPHESGHHRREQRGHGDRKRSRSRDRHEYHRRHQIKPKEHRSSKTSQQSLTDSPALVAWEDPPEKFVTDRKGDPNSLIYGTIHRYNIPHYHRFGAGFIIGIPLGSKIDRDLSNEKRLVTSERDGQRVGPREKYVFAKNERKGIKKLRLRSLDLPTTTSEARPDYISLRPSSGLKRKRNRHDSSPNSSSDEDGQNYRSIEGKAKQATRPTDPDLQYASESSASEYEEHRSFGLDDATKQQSMALSRKVADEPTNLKAWLELIRHQDKLLGLETGPTRRKVTLAERHSTADIKLSMYEKAVENFPKHAEGREHLLIGMMEEGAKIWETKKQASKWKTVLHENPGMIELWKNYLNFQQTNLSTFTHEECSSIYRECLQVLRAAAVTKANIGRERLEEITIYVLLRMTLFMRESGFAELSIAVWQALLEANFFVPLDLESSLKSCATGPHYEHYLARFQQFWESEVPRIGEIGAKGWRHYHASNDTALESKTQTVGPALTDLNLFRSWAEVEQSREAKSRDPLRTNDEAEEDDPYSVILFADVKHCIFKSSLPSIREALLDAFLLFCSLPPLSNQNSQKWARNWRADPFIRNELVQQSHAEADRWVLGEGPSPGYHGVPLDLTIKHMEPPHGMARGDIFPSLQHNFPTSTDTLFAKTGSWLSVYDAWEAMYPHDTGPVKLDFVRQALKSLVSVGAGGDNLAEYYLSFEWKNFPQSVKKVAKGLLKKRPLSLRLYNAYAILEFRSGNITAADHVLVTALNMSKTFSDADQLETILLWRTWAWELLYSGDYTAALQLLLAIPDDKIRDDLLRRDGDISKPFQPSSTALLKAQRALDLHSHLLTQGHPSHAILYLECQALLTYLSQSRSLTAALPILDSILPTLTTGHYAHNTSALEQTHLARAKLLHYHTTHVRNYRPALLREKLSESIALFPNNTIFLSLYAANESHSRLDDRVRGIMNSVVLKSDQETSITAWFFLIQTELRRGVGLGSTTHSVRATFERAVASETGRCSASLWKLYLLFYLKREDDKGKRAKEVFYRGMRNVPWAKRFIMLAFETELRDFMGFEELRAIWNVLGEKGLRVFVDLEEAFERIDEGRGAERTQVEGQRDYCSD
ncbi:MAG: hypothetical protein M1812_002451 [Candelaria pacifica]|nr:MAG: hypothetical protein M1812_002451 [Candelaria pacifica]